MSDNAVSWRSLGSGAARLWRGWAVAVLAVVLAAGGHQAAHTLMYGATEPIPWEVLGFSTALTAPVAVLLAGKRLPTWSTAVTTVFGQLAFHALYSLPCAGTASHSSGHHQGHHAMPVAADAAYLTHAAENTAATDIAMLVAHFLAAALTTLVILHGERSLVAIVAWLMLVPVKLVLATRPMSIARPKIGLPIGQVWIPHPMNVAKTHWTRGPPVLA